MHVYGGLFVPVRFDVSPLEGHCADYYAQERKCRALRASGLPHSHSISSHLFIHSANDWHSCKLSRRPARLERGAGLQPRTASQFGERERPVFSRPSPQAPSPGLVPLLCPLRRRCEASGSQDAHLVGGHRLGTAVAFRWPRTGWGRGRNPPPPPDSSGLQPRRIEPIERGPEGSSTFCSAPRRSPRAISALVASAHMPTHWEPSPVFTVRPLEAS